MTQASRRAILGGLTGAAIWPCDLARMQIAWAGGASRRIVGALEEDPPVINPPMTSIISSFGAGCAVYEA